MDFSLSDEQRMLQDTVDRLIADKYGFEQRNGYMKQDQGFDPQMWNQYAELGLLGVPFSEDVGGFGGGAVEAMVVMESFGKGLILEPYVASVLTSGILVAEAGSDAQKEAIIEPLVGGELKLAFAHGEPKNHYSETRVSTRAEKQGDGYAISGTKAVVIHGNVADKLVVSARTGGDEGHAKGLSLFLVDAGASGVSRRVFKTIDGLMAADITLENAPGELLGPEGGAADLIADTLDRGALAVCSEAVGAMKVACDMTLDYLKQRKQFGVPIGSFQSLQHRMVEMLIAMEHLRSATMKAAAQFDSASRAERRQAVAAAKVLAGQGGRFVSESAIQLHGGIGMTEEYAVPHYAKRLSMIDHQFGDHAYHLARFAANMEVPETA
ncbi:MAG: acyl-CoA dehydrogenase family protein [Ectothiorhodospiraceae bacterium]|nr:acyl-CoA dehydrogenase family protein [Ectothiorhodospiraceae bacterium]MCH8504439.1 acyl-CoA dehydrogenase [Ectothiorhodospiraceae bacterium]